MGSPSMSLDICRRDSDVCMPRNDLVHRGLPPSVPRRLQDSDRHHSVWMVVERRALVYDYVKLQNLETTAGPEPYWIVVELSDRSISSSYSIVLQHEIAMTRSIRSLLTESDQLVLGVATIERKVLSRVHQELGPSHLCHQHELAGGGGCICAYRHHPEGLRRTQLWSILRSTRPSATSW